MFAYIFMKDKVSDVQRTAWATELSKITPIEYYYFDNGNAHNIGVCNLAGEYLREAQGFTDTASYFKRCWPGQFIRFDTNGMYQDYF